MTEEFRMGDVVRLRKPHPCGSFDWEIVRLGADIGLVCGSCGRRVLFPRSTLEKRLKSFVSRGEPLDEEKARVIFGRDEPGA